MQDLRVAIGFFQNKYLVLISRVVSWLMAFFEFFSGHKMPRPY